MRLRTAVLALMVGIAVFLTGVLSSSPVPAIPAASIRILFDFGDGSYVWAAEPIGDPLATNATWHAVQLAASSNDITLDTAWSRDYGVGILDVGGRHPPAGFVGLLTFSLR